MQINISIYIRRPSDVQIEALARLRRNQGTVARGYEARWENSQARQQRSIRAEIVKCPFVSKGLPESPLWHYIRQMQYINRCYSMSSFHLIFGSLLLSERLLQLKSPLIVLVLMHDSSVIFSFQVIKLSLYGKGQTFNICLDSKQHAKQKVIEYLRDPSSLIMDLNPSPVPSTISYNYIK